MGHGYWIALTVLMVLRPETAHTYTRCVSRVVGNTAGIVVATAVTVLWHPTGVLAAVLALVFLAIGTRCPALGYVPLSAALAAAIVFLIDIGGTADGATMGQRILATVLGGGLAVASHVRAAGPLSGAPATARRASCSRLRSTMRQLLSGLSCIPSTTRTTPSRRSGTVPSGPGRRSRRPVAACARMHPGCASG